MPQLSQNEVLESEKRKSKIGIRLTIIYSLIYGGFVALSVFFPGSLGNQTVFGLNLAIAYGLGLIIIAIIMAIIYNTLVRLPNSSKLRK